MENGVGPSGQAGTPVSQTVPGVVSPEVQSDGRTISGHGDGATELGQLKPNQTASTSLSSRSIEGREGAKTEGLGKAENVPEKSLNELEEEQTESLKKAGTLLQQKEENRVVNLALGALENPEGEFPKDLRITIKLKNEKTPISLIPPDKKILANRDDADKLMALAAKLLSEHRDSSFKDYNPGKIQEQLEALKKSLDSIAEQMGKLGKSSEWKKLYQELEHRQVTVVAKGSAYGFEDDRPDTEESLESKVESISATSQPVVDESDEEAAPLPSTEEATQNTAESPSTLLPADFDPEKYLREEEGSDDQKMHHDRRIGAEENPEGFRFGFEDNE